MLEHNIPLNPDDSGLDLIFLAMCKQRLGRPAEAQGALAGAQVASEDHPGDCASLAAEFESFVHEFESLPEVSLPNLPADVFVR